MRFHCIVTPDQSSLFIITSIAPTSPLLTLSLSLSLRPLCPSLIVVLFTLNKCEPAPVSFTIP